VCGRRRDQCGGRTEDADEQRQQHAADLPADKGSGKGIRAHDCASKVEVTEGPTRRGLRRPLPLGRRTGRAGARAARNHRTPRSWDRDDLNRHGAASGRPSDDVRRAAAVFRHRHGVLHRGSAGGPPRGVAHLSNCAKSQMRWCEPHRNEMGWRRCSSAEVIEISNHGRFLRQG
jgi:hypothetical protein